jgi:hypothetical protein
MAMSLAIANATMGEARHKHVAAAPAHHSSSSHSPIHTTGRGRHAAAASSYGHRGHEVAHHGRHHGAAVAHSAPKTRYAYPLGLFMRSAPAFDTSPLSSDNADAIARAFDKGTADVYPARTLVRAGIVHFHPLHGGIFWRREPVKYIIMHSTETGVPVAGVNVINGWNSMGMRHPGAQYVVDRDGTIYQAVDPDLATVHVNIFKTLPGINNDNSIGIEMNHTGSQEYPQAQRDAVIKLVGYLKHRYSIEEGNIVTHRYAQQGDHTDPVHFDWDGFLAQVNTFHNQAIAYRSTKLTSDSERWQREPEPKANTYLKPHKELGKNSKQQETATPTQAPSVDSDMDNVDGGAPVTPAVTPAKPRPVIESPVPEASEAEAGAPVRDTAGGVTPNVTPKQIDGVPVEPVAKPKAPTPGAAVDPNFEPAVDPNFDPSMDSK